MAANKLLLTPADPLCPAIDPGLLADTLQDIGLIDAPAKLNSRLFYPTGDHFLQLITFLGCSPAIELDPPVDTARLETASTAGDFCHVFLDSNESLVFRADIQCPAPRCPRCRKTAEQWRADILAWREHPGNLRWSCTACGYAGLLTELVFRKTAGFGHTFVEIRGIYPSEAIPGDALLKSLETLSGGRWTNLYMKE